MNSIPTKLDLEAYELFYNWTFIHNKGDFRMDTAEVVSCKDGRKEIHAKHRKGGVRKVAILTPKQNWLLKR